MRFTITALILLALCAPLTGCTRSLSERDVREFIDKADDAARKRYAPEICELRGENFKMKLKFQGDNRRIAPSEMEIGRSLYCRNAGSFARLRQYELERRSIEIELAADRKTATVDAQYVEKMPFYDPDRSPPASPFDYREVQILTSHDRSIVGIEGGDIVFLSTEAETEQELVDKKAIPTLLTD
jgi:hypothetical protein